MKRSKPKQRGLAVLAILLVATSLAATVTGLVLKAQLQKYVGGWEDRLAIAVPFMLLHDNTDLRRMEQAKQRSQDEPKQPEQPVEPEKPAEPEKSLTDLMTSILSGVETPGYAITELAAEQYPLYLFIDQPEGAQAVTADSLIGSIAHSVVLMRLPDGADVSGIAKQVKDNADPRKWICVEAEKVIVKTKGNLVLLVMSTTDIADAIAANFDALSV